MVAVACGKNRHFDEFGTFLKAAVDWVMFGLGCDGCSDDAGA